MAIRMSRNYAARLAVWESAGHKGREVVPLNLKEAPWLITRRPDGSKTVVMVAKKAYVLLVMTVPHRTPPVKRNGLDGRQPVTAW